jgi:hypothetical protein
MIERFLTACCLYAARPINENRAYVYYVGLAPRVSRLAWRVARGAWRVARGSRAAPEAFGARREQQEAPRRAEPLEAKIAWFGWFV